MAKCIDRTHRCGPIGWIEAEEDRDGDRHSKCEKHRGPTDDGLHACDLEVRATEPHSYADDPADRTQDHRLEKELAEDRLLAGTDRLSNAYLTGSLGHRDQHDVHDSDTTHEKRVGTPGETPQVERLWQYI